MAKHQPKRFPQASVDRGIELYVAGTPMGQIEASTGADPKTIRRWVEEAGHKLRPSGRAPTYDAKALRAARRRLKSDAAVARVFGCSRTTVLRATGRAS